MMCSSQLHCGQQLLEAGAHAKNKKVAHLRLHSMLRKLWEMTKLHTHRMSDTFKLWNESSPAARQPGCLAAMLHRLLTEQNHWYTRHDPRRRT